MVHVKSHKIIWA